MRIATLVRLLLLGTVPGAIAACDGTENGAAAITLQVNSADTLDLVAPQGGGPVQLSVLLTPESGAIPPELTATPEFGPGATTGWLSGNVEVADTGTALLRVVATPGSLGPGVYLGSLRVTSPGDDVNAATVPVRLSIGAASRTPQNLQGLYTGTYTRVTTGGCTSETLTRPVGFSIEQSGNALSIRLALQDPDFIPLSGLRADAVAVGNSFSGPIPSGPIPASGTISGQRSGAQITGTVQITAPGAGCNGTPKYHAITYTARLNNSPAISAP